MLSVFNLDFYVIILKLIKKNLLTKFFYFYPIIFLLFNNYLLNFHFLFSYYLT